MDIITIVLASVGAIALTAGLGLLAKHLTIDHAAIEAKLDDILSKLEERDQ